MPDAFLIRIRLEQYRRFLMKKILFVLHLPPPVHGASVMGEVIHACKTLNDNYETLYVNLTLAEDLKEVGRFTFRKPAAFLQMRRQIREAVRSFQPDLVYMTPAVCLPGILKDALIVRMMKRMGCRLVLHLHNKEPKWMNSRLFRPLYRNFFAQTRVILLSERLYPDIAPFIGRDAVSICPNGVEVPPVHRHAESVPRILFFSNIIRSKGVSVLLDACRILAGQGLSFRCELAGKMTPDYPGDALWEEIRGKGLEGIVEYTGEKFDAAKWEAFSQADIFVHPTYNDCFPLVLLEAVGTGLPVVSTTEGGIPDIIKDGETGFLCPPRDAAAVADRIGRLLQDPDLRDQMGEAARRDYEARLTRERFEESFVSVIGHVL